MFLDPMVSLGLAIHSNRNGYALLLGSGISRPAQIPTGWEVVEDLVRKIAKLRGDDCDEDPADWYLRTFGAPANYSELLALLAPEPAERRRLLRQYFEPTKEEAAQGIKEPTMAHRKISQLVSLGFIKVIITTNFDRLMEMALDSEGVVPTVISTPDAVAGADPIANTNCYLVKVNGDYMDARIRNTVDELAAYDSRLDSLLDRIFDEFGMIVCGWSGDWDIALRAAIERCPIRRFTTFWTLRGAATADATKLINLRHAQPIAINSADDFFSELVEKVEALETLQGRHPLSPKIAAESVKRYLEVRTRRIELFDLVNRETESVVPQLSPTHFPVQNGFNPEELEKRLKRYESIVAVVQSIITVGCFWGNQQHSDLWVRMMQRIANPYAPIGGMTIWINLRLYPTLLLAYAGGVAAVASGNYQAVNSILTRPRVRNGSRDDVLVAVVNAGK